MDYLKEPQYYQDRYDLHTIESCLRIISMFNRVRERAHTEKQFDNLSQDEKDRTVNYLQNTQLIAYKIDRYKNREKEIDEWIDKDRILQNKFDTAIPPQVFCNSCSQEMVAELESKTLDYGMNEPTRVLFFYDCKKCNTRKAVYDDGTEFTSEPDKCPKCDAELVRSYKREKDIVTRTVKCPNCSYSDEEIDDFAEFYAKKAAREERESKLLSEYRKEFCMEVKEAEEYINLFEEMKFAREVYEYELQKYDESAKEKVLNINKLGITQLEKLLTTELSRHKFIKLMFDKPDISQFVVVSFSLQDGDTSRTTLESTNELKKLLKSTLEGTNWQLMSEGISYRLGYLSGRLKGYERDEDLYELFSRGKESRKKELDPEKQEKYGNSNTVQLSKLSAEFEAKQRARRKRLKSEPEGFILGNINTTYSCNLCYKSIRGDEAWWNEDGVTCLNCHRNLTKGVVPREILKNHKIWFNDWDVKREFGLHSTTVRKLTRNGELVGRDLLDEKGYKYFTVYMAADNVEFFKSHERKVEYEQKWHYIDTNGEVVWL